MSPQQQLALARQQAQLDLQPSIQANARSQAQAAEDARNQAAASRSAYAALARIQAEMAPRIGTTYSNAADRQAAYGSGFSNQVQGTLDKATADANALLAQNGMGAQNLTSKGGSVKDILYALGGYSPASVLNAQGSAFKTAAEGLPSQSVGLGIDAAKSANAAGAKNIQTLRNQLADLQARRPGLLAQALAGIQSNQSNAHAQYVQGQYLQNTLANGTVGRTGVDPTTGQPAVGYTVDPTTGAVVRQSTIDKRTAARTAALTKRDDGTVKALAGAHDWVEKQIKPGTAAEKVADMPIKIGDSAAVKDSKGKIVVAAAPIYAKQGGGTTHNIKEAATKPVYAQTPLPKPQFDQILNQVTGRLKAQLARYGYKPKQIRAFAMDIVDDYYVAEIQAKKDFTAGLAGENKRRKNGP